jgi:hypothetical protein
MVYEVKFIDPFSFLRWYCQILAKFWDLLPEVGTVWYEYSYFLHTPASRDLTRRLKLFLVNLFVGGVIVY